MNNKTNLNFVDEKEINQKIKSGEINPVHLPKLLTLTDIVKYQFCSDIIKFKNINGMKQQELAELLGINKSEVSKLCSYNLREFSQERLLGFIEDLLSKGASIDLQASWEKVKVQSKKIQSKLKIKANAELKFGTSS